MCRGSLLLAPQTVTPRAVADLSHLSDHGAPIKIKSEAFLATLLPRDTLIVMDLRSGYNVFRLHNDMRKYFTVSVILADHTVRCFHDIAIPFGWTRSGY